MERAPATPPKGARLPERDSWVEIGEVTRPQGLRGALLLSLYGDDPGNLIQAERVQLRGAPGEIEFRLERADAARRSRDDRVRIRIWLAGIDSREQASIWAGARLCIPEGAVRPLPPGEYYWREILGLRCETVDGREVGTVEEIWPTPANDVLVVRRGQKMILVPALRPVLARVDPERGTIYIDPPEGLLEEDV